MLSRAQRFLSTLRHCQWLGLSVEVADAQGVTLRLPHDPRLQGYRVSGALHGGALTTLMDTACGAATVCMLPRFEICPTLDLRIDCLRPPVPGLDLFGFAACQQVSEQVIFVRGHAHHGDPDDPLAQVVGTFMRMGPLEAEIG